jgi:hypothetical protein
MLFLWMSIQLLALGLAAARIPLSGRFPQPAETMATAEMLVAQIVGAALLFPLLLKDPIRIILAICGMWPMLFLAASLAGDPADRVVTAGIFATSWVLTLGVWRSLLTKEQSERLGLTIAIAWTIGGPVLAYLHAEYGGNLYPEFFNALSGPVVAGLNHLKNTDFSASFDGPTAFLLVLGSLISALRFLRLRQTINKIST